MGLAAAATPVDAAEPAPSAPAPAAPQSGHKPSAEELEQMKKSVDLMVWAAQTLKDKGAPQDAVMQAKADKNVQTYEAIKTLAEA